MKLIDYIVLILLFITLILSSIACVNSYTTIEYMKYSDYVLNDGLIQQDSLYVYNVENYVEGD